MDLIGASRAFVEILDQVRRVSPTDAAVLLAGDRGTGKDTIARAIHSKSPRRRGRFVALDCRSLPDGLVESELFGHRHGAFSGASESRAGRLQSADGGTLYLDGVDELPPRQQVRFLRAIESKEFSPLGSSTPRRVDFRLVAAACRDLSRKVAAGTFREDLYCRLNVVELVLPSLRERRDDISPLARALLEELFRAHQKPTRRFAPRVVQILEEYPWPGNLHELRGSVEAAFAAAKGETIEECDLPLRIRAPISESPPPTVDPPPARPEPFHASVRNFQRGLVLDALGEHSWDLGRTASSLCLERHQLKYLCAKLEIRRQRRDVAPAGLQGPSREVE